MGRLRRARDSGGAHRGAARRVADVLVADLVHAHPRSSRLGATTILAHFPEARLVATRRVIEVMHRQIDLLREFWEPRFPGQLARDPVVAEPLAAESIELEGRALVPIGVGHTDTVDTTVLHVPETGLVVAGDVVYNDVHVHLAQSDGGSRREWLAALDTVAALGSRAVVAGHKRPGNDDGPGSIAETSRYIRDFDQLVTMATSSLDLCERMLALHPNRVNPRVLWLSARALEA